MFLALARALSGERQMMILNSRRLLEDCNSAIAADPDTLEQCVKNVNRVVDDLVRELELASAGTGRNDFVCSSIGTQIGAHTDYSPRTASLLFDALFEHAAKTLPGGYGARYSLITIALLLNHSISSVFESYLPEIIHKAQVNERHRLARDLHDRTGHEVSLAILKLDMLKAYCHTNADKALERATDARNALAEALDGVRQLTSDLRQVTIEGSLRDGLQTYLDEAGGDLTTEVVVNGDETRVPPDVLFEVYLVLREGLRNSITHAKASRLVATVNIASNELRGRVCDDGVGISSQEWSMPAGHGLTTAKERTRLLGGSFSVSSPTEQPGTVLEIVIPLARGSLYYDVG